MSILLSLIKFRLSLLIALSGLFSYFLNGHQWDTKGFVLFCGILLLSFGGATLNNIQDVDIDSKMVRTRNRPLVKKRISISWAFWLALFFMIAGLWLLGHMDREFLVAKLGVVSIFFYNFIYTPMKRKSQVVLFFGVLSGLMAPIMGWLSAGGNIADTQLWLFVFLMFFWQFPQYWLVATRYPEDPVRAGIPHLVGRIPVERIWHLIFIWMTGYFLTAFLIGYWMLSNEWAFGIFSAGLSLLFFLCLYFIYYKQSQKVAFILINCSLLYIMMFLLG